MISVKDLTKAYGNVLAVDHVSFEVPKGQIVGFLGPNGAGKSTTIRMLTCYMPPTSGGATVNGFDIFHESEKVDTSLSRRSHSPTSSSTWRMRVSSLPDGTP